MAAATGASPETIAYTIGKRLDATRIPFLDAPREQKSLHWAERTLARQGASVVQAARYIPVGRVAMNMSAGVVRYKRGRFVGLDAIASLTSALYSTGIGIGAGEWFKGHPLGAIVVGLLGGMLIGLLLDWSLRRLADRKNRASGVTDPTAIDHPTTDRRCST